MEKIDQNGQDIVIGVPRFFTCWNRACCIRQLAGIGSKSEIIPHREGGRGGDSISVARSEIFRVSTRRWHDKNMLALTGHKRIPVSIKKIRNKVGFPIH